MTTKESTSIIQIQIQPEIKQEQEYVESRDLFESESMTFGNESKQLLDKSEEEEELQQEREEEREELTTVKDVQNAINISHPFGLKLWKPALYRKSRSVNQTAWVSKSVLYFNSMYRMHYILHQVKYQRINCICPLIISCGCCSLVGGLL